MSKYKVSAGSIIIKTDSEAERVGRYLESQFPSGKFTPQDVVDVAKSRSSPIHDYFEWENERAANLYRVRQARRLIREISVVVEDHDIRAFHSVYVKAVDRNSYVNTEECLNTQDLWIQVLQTALREVKGWSERYRMYRELDPVRNAIKTLESEIANEHERRIKQSRDKKVTPSRKKGSRKDRNTQDRV